MAGITLWDPPVDTSLIVSYDVFFAQVGGGGRWSCGGLKIGKPPRKPGRVQLVVFWAVQLHITVVKLVISIFKTYISLT